MSSFLPLWFSRWFLMRFSRWLSVCRYARGGWLNLTLALVAERVWVFPSTFETFQVSFATLKVSYQPHQIFLLSELGFQSKSPSPLAKIALDKIIRPPNKSTSVWHSLLAFLRPWLGCKTRRNKTALQLRFGWQISRIINSLKPRERASRNANLDVNKWPTPTMQIVKTFF